MKVRVEFEDQGQLASVMLADPPGNVIDHEIIGGLRQFCAAAPEHKDLKAVLLCSAGDEFSFGASIQEHRPEEVDQVLPLFHALFRDLLALSIPMLAVVRGRCLGGGLELAAFCQRIVAHPKATFGFPEIKLAVFPPLGSLILPWRLRQPQAEDLLLSGRIVSADEALDMHLIEEVDTDPEARARDYFTTHLRPKSAAALKFATRAARQHLSRNFERSLDALEALYLRELMKTHDAGEGIRAFLDKRPPNWRNE